MAKEPISTQQWHELRTLLLRHEQQRLAQLEGRLETAARQQQLRSDLPATITSLNHDSEFQASLTQPVTAALHASIEHDRERVAALLFPVMGPAIRRAVQEGLRGVLQRINLALEYGFSPRAWRWRLQAWRSGEPFAQIVLRHSLSYHVDEVFLIHRASGLVAMRRSRREVLALDQDAVASMLTAIQSFLQQSLGSVADDPLRTVELGSATLWLVNGPQVLLAALMGGEAPLELRVQLQEILEQAQQRLGAQLSDYQGELLDDAAVAAALDQLLIEQKAPSRQSGALRWLWWLLGLAAVALVAAWAYQHWRLQREHQALRQLIQNTPGLVLVDSETRGQRIYLHILRDALAPSVAQLQAELPGASAALEITEQAYLALAPELLLQRLHYAAALDSKQQLHWQADTRVPVLQLDGTASLSQWQRLADSLALLLPAAMLQAPALDAAALRRWLELPASVAVAWDGAELRISGPSAALDWGQLEQRLQHWPVRHHLVLQPVPEALPATPAQVPAQRSVHQLIETIDGTRLNFSGGVLLTARSQSELAELIGTLQDIFSTTTQESGAEASPYIIHLQGMSDGVGDEERNINLRQARADTIRAALIAAGIPADRIISTAAQDEAPAGYNPALRYAELRVEAK